MAGHRPVATLVAALTLAITALSGCSSIGDPPRALDAFAEALSSPERSMDVRADGRVRLAGLQVEFSGDYVLVGDDALGFTAVRSGEIGLDQHLALVQGHTVTAFGDESWSIDDRRYALPDPLNLVTRDDTELVGTAQREERHLVHVRVKEPAAAAGALATYANPVLSTLVVNSYSYDLYLDAAGTPVVADVTLAGSVSGELAGPIQAQLTVRFAAWAGIHELDLPFQIDSFPEGTTFVADNAFTEPVIWRDAAGFELLVPACSRRASDAFDGTEFDVRLAADDSPILRTEPTGDGPYRYSMVSATSSGAGQELPIIRHGASLDCTDRAR